MACSCGGGGLTLAGTPATTLVTIVRDDVQQRNDEKKRRADKFERDVPGLDSRDF